MQHGIIISEWLVIFMGFIVFIAGGTIGGAVVGALWLRSYLRDLQKSFENVKLVLPEE